MKQGIFTVLALAPILALAQSKDCHLTVRLNELKGSAKAYLVYEYGWSVQRIIDSAEIKNGTCLLKAKADLPVKTEIVVDHTGHGLGSIGGNADMLVLYLEPGNILVSGKDSVKYAAVAGSKLNIEYAKYNAAVLSVAETLIKAVEAEYASAPADKKKDTAFQHALMMKAEKVMKERDTLKYAYIQQNPGSYFSLVALREVAGDDIDVSKIEPLFKMLSPDLRSSKAGTDFAQKIGAARALSIGAMAPDFMQYDVNGKPVKLSDFRRKYVLLDFWASWCGPCRAENPNVVKAYNKYKDKNFTVLGVSLDQPGKKNAWLAAIKADSLPWVQVSDLKSWNNAAAKLYDVKAIPQNFLIDPTGKIVGKNLRGEALEKRLEELLN